MPFLIVVQEGGAFQKLKEMQEGLASLDPKVILVYLVHNNTGNTNWITITKDGEEREPGNHCLEGVIMSLVLINKTHKLISVVITMV